jgi:hypothetical protein
VLNDLSTMARGHVDEQRYSFTFLTYEGKRSDSRPYRFTSGERALGTHLIGVWVGPKVDLGAVERGKILHCTELNPGLLGYRYTD